MVLLVLGEIREKRDTPVVQERKALLVILAQLVRKVLLDILALLVLHLVILVQQVRRVQ